LHKTQDFFLVWFFFFMTHVTHAQCNVISVLSSILQMQLNLGRSLCWRLHWNLWSTGNNNNSWRKEWVKVDSLI